MKTPTLLNLLVTLDSGLAERGYQFLGKEDLQPLFGGDLITDARIARLQLLAEVCGARCDQHEEFNAWRFLRKESRLVLFTAAGGRRKRASVKLSTSRRSSPRRLAD